MSSILKRTISCCIALLLCSAMHANTTTVKGGTLGVRSHGGTLYTIEATLLLTSYPSPMDTFRLMHTPINAVYPGGAITAFMLDYPCVQVADGYLLSVSMPEIFLIGPHNIFLYAGNRVPHISNMINSGSDIFRLYCYFQCDSYVGPNGTPFTDSLNLQVNMPLGIVTTVPNVLYDDETDSIELVAFPPMGCTAYHAPEVIGGGGFVLYPDDSTYEWDPQVAGLYSIAFYLYEYAEYGAGNWLCRGISMREVLIDAGNATVIEERSPDAFCVYPNPVDDILYLSAQQECVELLNAGGQVVLAASQTNAIDVSALPAGVYFLRTSNGVQEVVVK